MKPTSGEKLAPPDPPERSALPFAIALGHQLRRAREDVGLTAADASRRTATIGLNWDRSTLSRVELGKRSVSPSDLFLLAFLYGRPISDLLPDERCVLVEGAAVTPAALRRALTRPPARRDGWSIAGFDARVTAALEHARAWARKLDSRFPNVPGTCLLDASANYGDEATVKAAKKLGADPFDLAVCAHVLWDRGLTAERDARVGRDAAASADLRARQARRGHATRALLAELEPRLQQLKRDRRAARRKN